MMGRASKTCFGKYRGVVENVIDPFGIGRIQVSVPDVYGDGTMAWAMPCLPGAGPGVGFYNIPPSGANVWIDFERGDPQFPVWSGGFWGQGDAPVSIGPTNPTTRAWVGDNFSLEFNDMTGLGACKLTVTTTIGDAVIDIGAAAVEITFSACSIKLAMDGVSINGTNLKVMP